MYSEPIAPLILGMTCVPLDPLKTHLMRLTESQEFFPEIPILRHFLVLSIPAIGLPATCPTLLDRVHHLR